MLKERGSIDKLKADRYILTTSMPLNGLRKAALAEIIGPSLQSQSDVLARGDLNHFLRKFPEVEKSHVKLWLSGAGVLERVLHAAIHGYTSASREEIEKKLRVYAQNPSFADAQTILEKQKVLIVSGPPGVGKSTLAEVLSFAYIADDWEYVAIRTLDEGFARLDVTKRQIFLFDDFLGRIALDTQALSRQDSEIARFMARVRSAKGSRFILTTRAYIYEEARRHSEFLADKSFDITRYVLDVGRYTRRVRAQILYNHLYVAGISGAHVQSLMHNDNLRSIIDHDNYNPRIIEWMTDDIRIGEIEPGAYATHFLTVLENPEALWDKAFKTHIPDRCRHLLIALFFGSEYGFEVEDLREAFEPTHAVLCKEFGITAGPKDFEDALRTVEGSFVEISHGRVSFINPSVRDYLAAYLRDKRLLTTLAQAAPTARWARSLCEHFKRVGTPTVDEWKKLAMNLLPLSERMPSVPIMKAVAGKPNTSRFHDASVARRADLMIDWWQATGEERFIDAAVAVVQHGHHQLNSWNDGVEIPALLARLKSCPGMAVAKLEGALHDGLSDLIRSHPYPDDLDRVLEAVEQHESLLVPELKSEVHAAIGNMLGSFDLTVDSADTETLSEYVSALQRLQKREHVDQSKAAAALANVKSRLEKLAENMPNDDGPSVSGSRKTADVFDDEDLRNLFAPLAARSD